MVHLSIRLYPIFRAVNHDVILNRIAKISVKKAAEAV
jgi:hypothetical protein